MLLFALLELIDSEEDKIWFEEFYNKYHDLVMFICLKRLNNPQMAEDTCHDVFVNIINNIEKIKNVDEREIKGYVYTIANGLAINKYNKEISRKHEELDNLEKVQVLDVSFDLYNVMELKVAIGELSDEEKTYLRLKYKYGLTLKEIGKIFDESESNASRKLKKIICKLKERLGGDGE